MLAAPLTSDVATFAIGAVAALGSSAVLARRVEHLGCSVSMSEAALGLVAALAADSPEITSSIAALRSGQRGVGIGVVLGSNVFNLAALLGLGALAAGRIVLHRRVIILEGMVAAFMLTAVLLLVGGIVGPGWALAVALAGFVPYVVVVTASARALGRLHRGRRAFAWLALAVREEEAEIGPLPAVARGTPRFDTIAIALSLGVVVAASIVMEHTGVAIGAHLHAPAIVVGGVMLAAVTSLPNAVAAVYLARRGRGAAVLSEAMNSNGLNVVVGLLVPGVVGGLGAAGSRAMGIAWWYAALTAAALAVAGARRGLGRIFGATIVAAYVAFVLALVL